VSRFLEKVSQFWPNGVPAEDYRLLNALAESFGGVPAPAPREAAPIPARGRPRKPPAAKPAAPPPPKAAAAVPDDVLPAAGGNGKPTIKDRVQELLMAGPKTAPQLAKLLKTYPPTIHNALKQLGAVEAGKTGEGRVQATVFSLP
jgi:hypothetical protein